MSRRLATVLFTDIVGSTARLSEMGDEAWTGLLRRHHAILGAEIEHFGGREVKSTGDGILAVFGAPAQAVRCAVAIRDALQTLGLEIRAGIHTGEIEEDANDVGGVAVHVAARVLDLADPGEILVSRTVKDVIGGANIRLVRRRAHRLEGIEGEWRLYAVASEPVEERPRDLPGPVDRLTAWLSTRRGRAIGIAALVVLVLIAAFAVRGLVRPGGATASGYDAVAVLPFDNLSPDRDDEYFSDGMTEDIITRLSKLGAFDVISRTSVMRYKDTDSPLREIARELGVDAIVEGSVRRAGDRVRVTAKLVDGRTDTQLWAETYDRDLADVFAVQSDIAGRVAGSLQATLEPGDRERLTRSPTDDLRAYDFYLKARQDYGEYTAAANERAITLFRRAIELDPGFAEAWAGLADAYAQEALLFAPEAAPALTDSAMSAAERAIRIDPEIAEGHKARGLVLFMRGRVEDALEATRKAAELNQSYQPAVHNVGTILLFMGRLDEGVRWLERSRELDPLNVNTPITLAGAFRRLEDDVRVDAYLSRAEAMHPGHSAVAAGRIVAELVRGETDRAMEIAEEVDMATASIGLRFIVGETRLMAGDLEGARRALEPLETVSQREAAGTPVSGPATLALVLQRSGEAARAAELLDRLESDLESRLAAGDQTSLSRYRMSRVLALQGEDDRAVEWFRRAVEAGFRDARWARRDPALESLRGQPEFEGTLTELDALVDAMRRRVDEARES
ncbi:MAG: tetratricopeptide repeat protein [Gemmatimonadetes bacterium]|nr:tetratricopeptide repeat protein [Gemmatimonadota bacterium]